MPSSRGAAFPTSSPASCPAGTSTRLWLIARPLSGFSETFSQYVMEVQPGGGSDAPDAEAGAEHWLFFTDGLATLTLDGTGYEMEAGAYAYIPPGMAWTLLAGGKTPRPASTGCANSTNPPRAFLAPRPSSSTKATSHPLDARHRRALGHHPLCRPR
jgi:quercetin dioxygenase-like cupin family protein